MSWGRDFVFTNSFHKLRTKSHTINAKNVVRTFATFKLKVTGIKCGESLKVNMSQEFEVVNCWKGRKICLKKYLMEQKFCSLLSQLEEIPKMYSLFI